MTSETASGAGPGGGSAQTEAFAAPAWGRAVHLATAGKEPTIAADTQGNAVAAWREDKMIWARSFTAAGWSDPVLITNAATSPPSVTFAAGIAWIAWAQPDRGADRIVVRSFEVTRGWSAPQVISTQETLEPASATEPNIINDASGHATLVWIQPRDIGSPPFAWSSRYAPGSGWSVPQLFGGGPWAQTPTTAMDGDGNAIASWIAEGEAFHSVRVAELHARTGWGPVMLPWGRQDALDWTPRVAINRKGDKVAVWVHRRCCTLGRDVYASHRHSGGWSAPQRIEWDEVAPSTAPQVGIDAEGNGFSVWRQGEAGAAEIWTARYRNESGWAGARRLQPSEGDAGEPQLIVQQNGDALIVWPQDDRLWLARYEGGVWSFSPLAAVSARHTRISQSGHDGAIVVWQQGDGIWATSLH